MTQDPGLVLVCYCVCAAAAYALLDIGDRAIQQAPPRRRRWLLAAAAIGTFGCWAGALAGVRAFAWPWVQAYAAAALWAGAGALATAAGILAAIGALPARWAPPSPAAAAIQAAGLTGLELGAIGSLRLLPAPHYAALPLALALLAAVATAGLTQALGAALRRQRGARGALRVAAALLLAGAFCAVQFAFLSAVGVAAGTTTAGGVIPGAWAGQVLAPVAAGLAVIAVLLSRMEAQVVAERHARERQRRADESIRRVTYFDGVTGLPNRSQFNEALIRQLISVNGRRPPPFGVLHAEIRNYAALLERLGQERLNRLLTALAKQLSASAHDSDLLARLSHDSFVFLLRRREPPDVAAALEAVAALLEAPVQDAGEPVELAWALGSSHYPGGGDTTRALLRAAMRPQRELRSSPGRGSGASPPSLLLA